MGRVQIKQTPSWWTRIRSHSDGVKSNACFRCFSRGVIGPYKRPQYLRPYWFLTSFLNVWNEIRPDLMLPA